MYSIMKNSTTVSAENVANHSVPIKNLPSLLLSSSYFAKEAPEIKATAINRIIKITLLPSQ